MQMRLFTFLRNFLSPYQVLRMSLKGLSKVFGKAYSETSRTYKIERFAKNLKADCFKKIYFYKGMRVKTCYQS